MAASMKPVQLMPFKVSQKSFEVRLTAECYARLSRLHNQVISGKSKGGWQTLIKDLYSQISQHESVDAEGKVLQPAVLIISEPFLHRLIPPAVRYDSGGYQQVIRWVLCMLLDQHRVSILGQPQTLQSAFKGKE